MRDEALEVLDVFNWLHQKTDDEKIAASLTLSTVLYKRLDLDKELSELLGHEICMGIRHGLFGSNASADSTIHNDTFFVKKG